MHNYWKIHPLWNLKIDSQDIFLQIIRKQNKDGKSFFRWGVCAHKRFNNNRRPIISALTFAFLFYLICYRAYLIFIQCSWILKKLIRVVSRAARWTWSLFLFRAIHPIWRSNGHLIVGGSLAWARLILCSFFFRWSFPIIARVSSTWEYHVTHLN